MPVRKAVVVGGPPSGSRRISGTGGNETARFAGVRSGNGVVNYAKPIASVGGYRR